MTTWLYEWQYSTIEHMEPFCHPWCYFDILMVLPWSYAATPWSSVDILMALSWSSVVTRKRFASDPELRFETLATAPKLQFGTLCVRTHTQFDGPGKAPQQCSGRRFVRALDRTSPMVSGCHSWSSVVTPTRFAGDPKLRFETLAAAPKLQFVTLVHEDIHTQFDGPCKALQQCSGRDSRGAAIGLSPFCEGSDNETALARRRRQALSPFREGSEVALRSAWSGPALSQL